MTILIARHADELRRHFDGRRRAVVMTLGALHEGHASLLGVARDRIPDAQLIVTVFVNPLQFGADEDFDRYPRTLDEDVAVAQAAGADLVFAPLTETVYPDGQPEITLRAGVMGERLEGAHRPGHFDGMLTVVAKLLHLTAPDVAVYGAKDAQQLTLITRMVRDLNFPVEVVAAPTLREADGLAMSSRNRYLSPDERATALALSRALRAAQSAPPAAPAVRQAAHAVLASAGTADPPLRLDYLALVNPADFTEVPDDHTGEALLVLAARVGETRLIDNIRLTLGAMV